MGWDGKDRRRRKRYAVKNGTMRYRKGRLFGFLRLPSPKYLLLNFSEVGCYFITREALREGQALRVWMEAPNVHGRIRASGRVVWSRKSADLKAFHVGVEFTAMPVRSRALLKKLLDSAILENVEISTHFYLKEIERL